ncbi:hypothetical protein OQA88_9315 [Cercophora sp. LCS_1]
MDPFSTAAGVIAVVQIADSLITICKYYLETAKDAPSDLRFIFIETSTLKSVLDSVTFLSSHQHAPTSLAVLAGQDGPIEACRETLTALIQLFPLDYRLENTGKTRQKKRKVDLKAILTALAWPLKETKARKLLADLVQHKTTISLALSAEARQVKSNRDIKDIRATVNRVHAILTYAQRSEIFKWIRGTDPSALHHKASSNYESGTGDWIFRSDKWKAWTEGRSRCIWIHGIPGAGKTILASHIIDAIEKLCNKKVKAACVYYYCYFGNHQDEAVPLLKWVIESLCRRANVIPDVLHKLFQRGGEPSQGELLRVLEAIVQDFETVHIVVDAMDESMPRDNLLRVVRDLATDARFQNIRILATSRQYIDIEDVMGEVSPPISMRNEWLDKDIRCFVKAKLARDGKLQRWPPELQLAALEALSAKAKGMFRWVVCQMDILGRLEPRREIVDKALETLPETLDETYERIFLQIPTPTFAHYTVWEFLESQRIKDGPAAFFAVDKEATTLEYANLVFLEAMNVKQADLSGIESKYVALPNIESNFDDYCLASSLFCLQKLRRLNISKHNKLKSSAIQILDVSQPHFGVLEKVAKSPSGCISLYETVDFNRHVSFWESDWDDPPAVEARTFLNLCWVDETMEVARSFLEERDERSREIILRGQISLRHVSRGPSKSLPGYSYRSFRGTTVELLAQLGGDLVPLNPLIDLAAGYFNSSHLLMSAIWAHMVMHGHSPSGNCPQPPYSQCPLERLLDLGADPNGKGYRITPLQIAAAVRDIKTIRLLLDAGAELDNRGDEDGFFREGDTELGRGLIRLQGMTPAEIMSRGDVKLAGYWVCKGDNAWFEFVESLGLASEAEKFLKQRDEQSWSWRD